MITSLRWPGAVGGGMNRAAAAVISTEQGMDQPPQFAAFRFFASFSLQLSAFSLIFNVPGTFKMTGIVVGTFYLSQGGGKIVGV